MSVYKYDENTQTMREYDVAYQVQTGECPAVPNGIEKVNDTSSFDVKFKVDSSWLPYFTVTDAEIKIGKRWSGKDYSNTNFWNIVQELWFEATDVPVNIAGEMTGMEQLYIYNNARWGQISRTNDSYTFSSCKYVTIKDNNEDASYGGYYFPGVKETYCLWIPNGTAITHSEGSYNSQIKNIVYCGKNITVNNNDNSSADSTIYYNEDAILSSTFEDANFTGTVIPFAKDETEWLENYFNIEQDGESVEWYEDTISNDYGKWIRLKKNNATLGTLMYWKDGEIEEEIGTNLTNSSVTKTGSITLGDTTKTYSITQKPIERTVRARMYFNPVEEDGKMFNNFCVWPVDWQFGVAEAGVSSILNCIQRIRYKAAGDTTWTNMSLPTVEELKIKSTNIAGHDNENIIALYTLEINTAGYYDVEWTYYPEKLWNLGKSGNNDCARFGFMDRKYYYDTVNHYYEQKINEDMYLENTPFVMSIDLGQQWCTKSAGVVGAGANIYIRDWDDNPRMETLSIGPSSTAAINSSILEGMMSRGLKYLVYNNLYRGEGHYFFVNCDNFDNKFSNEGILFYVTPERQRFDDWFLGCSAAPHIIYLHPDIYAMTNHGFDDTLTGWEQWRYEGVGSPEIRELPANWRTLVPNYIGE